MSYSSTIAALLKEAGEGPPALAARGVLCPSCYKQSIQDALPVILPHLRSQIGSPEHIAMSLGGWGGSLDSPHSVAVDIVTAAAGERPPWLFHSHSMSMAALYAARARARGMTPPRIAVIHEESRLTPTLFNRDKRTVVMTPVGGFNAWHFNYRDTDRGFWHLILVGALGTAFDPRNTWNVNNNQQIITSGSLDMTRNDVTNAVNRLATPPGDGYFSPDPEGVSLLVNAVKQLL